MPGRANSLVPGRANSLVVWGCWLATVLVCTFAAGLSWASDTGSAALAQVVEAEREQRCVALPAVTATDPASTIAMARHARCALAEGGFDRAVDLMARYEAAARRTGLEGATLSWLPELRARVALLDGRPTEAAALLAALREASAEGTSAGVRSRLLYYQALATEAAGDAALAQALYTELLSEYPASTYASRAQLFDLHTPVGAEALDMAARALSARHYAAAEGLLTLAACGEAASCPPHDALASGDPSRVEAAYQLGFLLYRYRREFVARALPWFETLIYANGARLADARHGYASAVTRMGRHEEARRAWAEFAAQHPDDSRVDAARFSAAWSYLEEDRYDEAIAAFRRYRRTGARTADAAWWQGWAAYQAGRCADAVSAWASLETAQANYWRAACAAASGDAGRAEAVAQWEAIRADDPWGYYGLLSARRLARPFVADAPAVARPNAGVPGAAAAASSLGLAEEARLLGSLEPGAHDDPIWRVAVEALTSDWGRWLGAWAEVSARPPSDAASALAWWLAHPRFYAAVVEAQAAERGIRPSLIWAIMQKESSYNPRAISRSDAMGLMQVIPQTAEAIARRLDERYVDGMLFEPYHAIRYGAWYLGVLQRHFEGQPALAIIAYNAGPLVVEEWVDRSGDAPFDVFVEEIPFDQARDYLRRVISIQVRYEIAAGETALLGTETIGGILPTRIVGRYGALVDF